jgi:hypothetical protein
MAPPNEPPPNEPPSGHDLLSFALFLFFVSLIVIVAALLFLPALLR